MGIGEVGIPLGQLHHSHLSLLRLIVLQPLHLDGIVVRVVLSKAGHTLRTLRHIRHDGIVVADLQVTRLEAAVGV